MSLKFTVDRMEHREERGEILLTGTVPDGVLVTGMRARTAAGESLPFDATVVEIEHFARESRFEGTRLTFEYASDEERAEWLDRKWQGVELILEM